jgi:hypothetical protein
VTAFQTYKVMGASPYFQQKDGGTLGTGDDGSGSGQGGGSGGGGGGQSGGSTPGSPKLLRKVSGTSKPVHRHAVITFRLSRAARVWITIERGNGKVVQRRRVRARYGAGRHRIRWFLRNWHGYRVPKGRYVAAVLALDRSRVTDSGRTGLRVRRAR